MSRITALFVASLRQALPTRRTVLFALLELVPAVIYFIATSNRTDEIGLQRLVEIGTGTLFALVVPVVSMVIAAGALGNERRDMTLSFIALRPISRRAIALAKLAAAFVAAGALNLFGALALGVANAVRFGSEGVFIGLLAGAVVATLAYVSLFLPIGFLTDRAVMGGMAYLLVFENGIAFAVAGLAYLSPWRIGASIFLELAPTASAYLDSSVTSLAPGRALLALIVYVIASIALTSMLLQSRDLA